MARIIVYDGREHTDPDPGASIEEVKDIMSDWYPDLATAQHKQEKRGSDTLHIFSKRLGTKGRMAPSDLAALLSQTPPASTPALHTFDELADNCGQITPTRLNEYLQTDHGNNRRLEDHVNDLTRHIHGVRTLRNRLINLLAA